MTNNKAFSGLFYIYSCSMIAGAGLGSSAAMSVCFSSSLLLYSAQVSSTKCTYNGPVHKVRILYLEKTTVYVPSSELGLPQHLSRRRMCPSPPEPGGGGGEAHSHTCEGLGESQFRRLEKKLSTLPTLWASTVLPVASRLEGGGGRFLGNSSLVEVGERNEG
jgi:hypothetical protein